MTGLTASQGSKITKPLVSDKLTGMVMRGHKMGNHDIPSCSTSSSNLAFSVAKANVYDNPLHPLVFTPILRAF